MAVTMRRALGSVLLLGLLWVVPRVRAQRFGAGPIETIAIIGNAQMVELPGLLFVSSIGAVGAPTPATSPSPGS